MLRAEQERDSKESDREGEREKEREEPVLGNYNDGRRWKTLESTPTDFVPPLIPSVPRLVAGNARSTRRSRI